jgi:hypothetical protein
VRSEASEENLDFRPVVSLVEPLPIFDYGSEDLGPTDKGYLNQTALVERSSYDTHTMSSSRGIRLADGTVGLDFFISYNFSL